MSKFKVGPVYGPMRPMDSGIFPTLPKPPQVSEMSRDDLSLAPKRFRDATQESPYIRKTMKRPKRTKRAGGRKNIFKGGRIHGW